MKAVFPNPDKLLRSGGAGKIVIGRTVDNIVELPITSVKKTFRINSLYSSLLTVAKLQWYPSRSTENQGYLLCKIGSKSRGQNCTKQNRYVTGRDEGTAKESTFKINPQRIITY